MLELIGIIAFTRHLVSMARLKGRTGWFAAIGPVFWIGGELAGACGAGCAGLEGIALYLGALVGAAIGVAVAYGIIAAIPADPDSPMYRALLGESGTSCPACGSLQTEVIATTVVCNACGRHCVSGPLTPPTT